MIIQTSALFLAYTLVLPCSAMTPATIAQSLYGSLGQLVYKRTRRGPDCLSKFNLTPNDIVIIDELALCTPTKFQATKKYQTQRTNELLGIKCIPSVAYEVASQERLAALTTSSVMQTHPAIIREVRNLSMRNIPHIICCDRDGFDPQHIQLAHKHLAAIGIPLPLKPLGGHNCELHALGAQARYTAGLLFCLNRHASEMGPALIQALNLPRQRTIYVGWSGVHMYCDWVFESQKSLAQRLINYLISDDGTLKHPLDKPSMQPHEK